MSAKTHDVCQERQALEQQQGLEGEYEPTEDYGPTAENYTEGLPTKRGLGREEGEERVGRGRNQHRMVMPVLGPEKGLWGLCQRLAGHSPNPFSFLSMHSLNFQLPL